MEGGGRKAKRQLIIKGKNVRTIAEAVNAIYRERGVERRVEVKYDKHKDVPYLQLTNVDLRLLDVKREPLRR